MNALTRAVNARRRLWKWLRQVDAPLTSDLLLRPADDGLGLTHSGQVPDATTRSTCGFCSTGCNLTVHMRQGVAVNLTPTVDYSVNLGMACPKGWEALSVLRAADRAVSPLVRERGGRRVAIDWTAAAALFCNRFQDIQRRHGPHSVAFLSTGQIATEEMALLGAFAKFGMGVLHGDGNTRQCMATSVVSYKESFGFDAPPYTYADFEESDVIFLIGANLCVAHPIMWQRICRNRHRPAIFVVDPRRTETAMAATHHLAIRPKSDLTLFYGLAHLLIREGWIDADFVARHCSDFEKFRQHVEPYSPEFVAAATGLSASALAQTASAIHRGKRVSFWWTMGVNQSYDGVRTAQSIINLALLTGNIGRPGTGANSITGQCNAMGSRLFSNTTNLLGGHDFKNAQHRQKVANILDIPLERIPNQPSWAYDQIIEGVLAGKIRGLWIIATNPAHSWINQHMLRDVFSRLEFLVVQDMYHSTATAEIAHLLLPAAGWGEKDGTFVNSERRVSTIKKVAEAPGQALPDFAIFKLLADAWGCGEMFAKWSNPASTFELLKRLSAGQPCDITGIADYALLDSRGGIQWPYPASGADDAKERRLFLDGEFFHADGRARFVFGDPTPLPEPPSARYPLLLMTGRGAAAQWHTETRTSKSAVLRKLAPKGLLVEINPIDARAANIRPNDLVVVESQRGAIPARAFVTHRVQPGHLFMAMHDESVNRLTLAHFDPYSRQPSYKDCAVAVRPAAPGDAIL